MNNILIVLSVAIIGIGFFSLSFFLTRRDTKRSIYFVVFSLALIFYFIGDFLVLTSKNPDELAMALKIENIGTPFLATYFLLISFCLFNFQMIKPKLVKVLTAYSFTMALLMFTNEYHLLYYKDFTIIFTEGSANIYLETGILFTIHQIIILIYFFLAYKSMFKNTKNLPLFMQNRYVTFLAGSFVVLFFNLINIFEVLPRTINFTPLAISITMALVIYTLKKHKILDLETLATEEAIEYMDDIMLLFDYNWSYVYSNLSAKRLIPALITTITSTPIEQIEGMPLSFPHNYISDSDYSFELYDKKGNIHYYRAQISPIGSAEIFGWSVVIRDNTEVMTLLQKMKVLAKFDMLTKIYNRRYFLEKLSKNLSKPINKGKSLTIIMFDLDFFKVVNDTYGHLVGDEILKVTAKCLADNLIENSLVARYGGEEFIAALIGFDIKEAKEYAEKLRVAVSEIVYTHSKEDITISASFGVGQIKNSTNVYGIIAVADKALYIAKNSGRNCVKVLVE